MQITSLLNQSDSAFRSLVKGTGLLAEDEGVTSGFTAFAVWCWALKKLPLDFRNFWAVLTRTQWLPRGVTHAFEFPEVSKSSISSQSLMVIRESDDELNSNFLKVEPWDSFIIGVLWVGCKTSRTACTSSGSEPPLLLCCPAGAFLMSLVLVCRFLAGGKVSPKEKASVILTSLSLNTGVLATDTLVTDTSLDEGIFFLKVKPLKNKWTAELEKF